MTSRPIPFVNVTSGSQVTGYQTLTPRTPHSRSGRAEEGYADVEEVELGEIEDYRAHASQQSEPLLSEFSGNASFPPSGYRNRGDDYRERAVKTKGLSLGLVLSRLPLVFGGIVAMFLLILIGVAIKEPDSLQEYLADMLADNKTFPNLATPSDVGTASTPIPAQLDETHTISYENYTKFPLLGIEYRAECQKLNGGFMAHSDYWEPSMHGLVDVPHIPNDHPGESKTCSSTITYQLDGTVGLLADLALMAQVAALARERNRTFFVDDTYWNRGKWTDHFQDVRTTQIGHESGCKAPPPNELVACPRLARHWVVNSRTAKFHFGNSFSDKYENAYGHSLNRLKPIFEFSLISLNETIRPNTDTAALIRRTREEMTDVLDGRASSSNWDSDDDLPSYIGIHVRRGDQLATSWRFHNGYVPIINYTQAVLDTWSRLRLSSSSPLTLYIASDSPAVQLELDNVLPPDISIFSLSRSEDPELRALASPKEYVQAEFALLGEEERKRATKGMIVDFAMVSGMWSLGEEEVPEATVCTISSSVCRLAAVGLGWDQAFGAIDEMGDIDKEGKRWVEIDNNDTVMPVWEAFQLF